MQQCAVSFSLVKAGQKVSWRQRWTHDEETVRSIRGTTALEVMYHFEGEFARGSCGSLCVV